MTPECKQIRKKILEISNKSGHGHIPTCFSVVECLHAVYGCMRHNPVDPSWEGRDIFLLSKGHASLAFYGVLASYGYFDISKVDSFGAFLSDFGCHADRFKVPGVEASTGSLGHGIGLAVGMALAARLKKTDRMVYVLIGDGESNEGSVWEAVMVAVNLKLTNLRIIYDNNMSHARGLQMHNPVERFEGFGCDVVQIDGHDVDLLKKELAKKGEAVKVIVADTTKGYGCKTLVENQYEWHRKSPTDAELEAMVKELDEEAV